MGDDTAVYWQATGLAGFAKRIVTLHMTVHWFSMTRHEWFLQHSWIDYADGGCAHCNVELWDPDHRLMAIVNQRAIILDA